MRGAGWSGALSARFMVYFTLALFHTDSYDDVAENLVGALDGMDEAIQNKSNFTRARARLGPRGLWRRCSRRWPGRWRRMIRSGRSGGGCGWRPSTGSCWTPRTPAADLLRRADRCARGSGRIPARAGGHAERLRDARLDRRGGGRLQHR